MKKWIYTGLMALGLLGFAAGVWPQARTSFKIFDEGTFVSTIQSINCIGSGIICTENLSAHRVDVSVGAGATPAPASAEFVTLSLDGTLTAERVLTGTVNQIIITDGGANTTVTLSTPQDIDTGATPTFASISFNADTNQIILDADEGSGFTGTITLASLTAARTYTFPDASGEVTLLGQTIDLTSEVTGVLPIANGGTDLSTTPTNGQLLIGNGVDYTLATLTGTVNQITVTNGSGTITLSTPQDIAVASSPTFASLSLNADTNQIVLDADEGSGFTGTITLASLTAARTYTFPDATGEVTLLGQTIDLTSEVTGTLPVTNGGTGTTSFTAGSVVFSNGTIITQDNANFFWDDSNNRLGIGTSSPSEKLHVLVTSGSVAGRIETTATGTTLLAALRFKTGESADVWQWFARDGDFFVGIDGTADFLSILNGGNVNILVGVLTAPSLNINAVTNQILFDADGTFTGQLTMEALTASRTWTFPDETGIVALNDASALGHLQILDRVTADTTVVNTTTETIIYTFSVPANIMSDDRKLRLQLLTEVTDNTGGGAQVLTVRLKFGATTLSTKTIGTSTGSTDVGYPIEGLVVNDGATNAQEAQLKVQRDSTSASNLVTSIGRGSSSEDTTANVTLVVTIEWDIADPDLSITMNYASLELI